MLENAQNPQRPLHPVMMAGDHFPPKKPASNEQKYTPNQQVYKPYTAMETRVQSQSRTAPWLPVKLIYPLVASGAKTPMRKLTP